MLLQCHHAETARGTAVAFKAFVCVSLDGRPLVAKYQLHASMFLTAHQKRMVLVLIWTSASAILVSLVLIAVFLRIARPFRIASVTVNASEITNASVTLGMLVQTAARFHVHLTMDAQRTGNVLRWMYVLVKLDGQGSRVTSLIAQI